MYYSKKAYLYHLRAAQVLLKHQDYEEEVVEKQRRKFKVHLQACNVSAIYPKKDADPKAPKK